MVIFEARKNDLELALKQIKTLIRSRRYQIYHQTDFLIQPGRLVIRIDGSEAYCKISNEGIGMFEMYFMDFFEAIDSSIEEKFDNIHFILTEKIIQISKRKLSILGSDFDYKKVLKQIESPLSSLNFDINADSQFYKSSHTREFCLLNDINKKFNSDSIEKDIDFLWTYLNKYKIYRQEISKLIYQKLYEIDASKLF